VFSNGSDAGHTTCECGFNAAGFSYCMLSQGDEEFTQIKLKFEFVIATSIFCHTLLRYGPCRYLYADEYQEYIKAKRYYEMYPQLVFNDRCIKKIYTNDYWSLFRANQEHSFVFCLFFLVLLLFN